MIAQLTKNYIRVHRKATLKRLVSYVLEGRPLTTKGRFINKILLFLFKITPHNLHVKPNVVYILGTGRSGTTFLGLLLNTIEGIAWLNEPKAIWYSADERDDIQGNFCPGVHGEYFLSYSEKSLNKIKGFYNFYSSLLGAKTVLDKYPEQIWRIESIFKQIDGSKAIFIYRDPYETIGSIVKWSEKHGVDDEDWWGKNNIKWKLFSEQIMDRNESDFDEYYKAAYEWLYTMKRFLQVYEVYASRLLLVKYNTLVKNFQGELETIVRFIGFHSVPSYEALSVMLKDTNMDYGYVRETLSPMLCEELDDVHKLLNSI